MEHKEIYSKPHAFSLENREKGAVTGVSKVIAASDSALSLETGQGGLTIAGSGIKIEKYDVETGALTFSGAVSSIKYTGAKVPLLKRIFS